MFVANFSSFGNLHNICGPKHPGDFLSQLGKSGGSHEAPLVKNVEEKVASSTNKCVRESLRES